MKIIPQHYDHMKNAIAPLVHDIDAREAVLWNDKRVKDIETRLAFDYMYAAKLTPWICNNLYTYCDDSHIETALKRILRELVPLRYSF